jgi:hypothetical protein
LKHPPTLRWSSDCRRAQYKLTGVPCQLPPSLLCMASDDAAAQAALPGKPHGQPPSPSCSGAVQKLLFAHRLQVIDPSEGGGGGPKAPQTHHRSKALIRGTQGPPPSPDLIAKINQSLSRASPSLDCPSDLDHPRKQPMGGSLVDERLSTTRCGRPPSQTRPPCTPTRPDRPGPALNCPQR